MTNARTGVVEPESLPGVSEDGKVGVAEVDLLDPFGFAESAAVQVRDQFSANTIPPVDQARDIAMQAGEDGRIVKVVSERMWAPLLLKTFAVFGECLVVKACIEHITVQKNASPEPPGILRPIESGMRGLELFQHLPPVEQAVMVTEQIMDVGSVLGVEQSLQPSLGGEQGILLAAALTPPKIEDISTEDQQI
jgi:hypothetical protein